MDIVQAVRRELALHPEVAAVLGSDEHFDMWLFQERLYAVVENSSSVAVVLSQRGNWTSPNAYNTARFPRLLTEIWADPDRVSSAVPGVDLLSAKDKVLVVHEAMDQYLHRPMGSHVWWPTDPDTGTHESSAVRVLGSTRLGELDFFPVPDSGGMMRATCFYGLGVG